jgi:hypothetical protein
MYLEVRMEPARLAHCFYWEILHDPDHVLLDYPLSLMFFNSIPNDVQFLKYGDILLPGTWRLLFVNANFTSSAYND